MNITHWVLEDLRSLVERADQAAIERLFEGLRVQDVAAVLMEVEEAGQPALFQRVAPGRQAEVFAYLEPDHQQRLMAQLPAPLQQQILSALAPDDLTALLEELPAERVRELLTLLPQTAMRRAMILLGYPEDSVGRLMTPWVVAAPGQLSIGEALERVRDQAERGETVNSVFVTDAEGRLRGTVPIKRFILARPERPVSSLVEGDPVKAQVSDNQETAARLIQHYDLEALPVVDAEDRLLGMVTVDDVLDLLEEEATEDFHKMGSVGTLPLSLRDAPATLLYRKRIGWLLILVGVNLVSGTAISLFEDAIQQLIVLVFFLPLVLASGGNAGAQSATLMVRALAVGDVETRDWLRMWGKELFVAAGLGLTMGLAVSLIGLWRGGFDLALMVALSMTLVVFVGSVVGLSLPLLLTRFRMDPASASAPLITSIADVTGVLIFFTAATLLLGLPGPGGG